MEKQTHTDVFGDDFIMPSTLPELWDLAAELWDRIADEKDKKQKAKLVTVYNMCAKAANTNAGREAIVLITSKTKVLKTVPGETLQQESAKVIVKTAFVQPGVTGATLTKKTRDTKKTTVVTVDKTKPEKAPKVKGAAKTTTPGEPKVGSIIDQILTHHKAGLSNKEIVEKGFNKSTVNRQVSEFKKRKLAANDTK
jgi:hypothetical protein